MMPSKGRMVQAMNQERRLYFRVCMNLFYITRKQIYFEIISRTSTVIVKLEKRKRVGSQDITVRIANTKMRKHEINEIKKNNWNKL